MARPQLSSAALAATRGKLSDAALQIYRAGGIEAVTFRALAEALGISHTQPYRYFDNKDALLAHMRCTAVMGFDAFVRARESGADAFARLKSVFVAYMDFAREHPDDYRLIFVLQQPPPDRYPELLAARQRVFDHVLGVVQDGIDEGRIRGDAREVAHAYWAGLHGLMTLHVANQLVHGYSLERLAPRLLERLLGTVQPGAVTKRARKTPTPTGARRAARIPATSARRVRAKPGRS